MLQEFEWRRIDSRLILRYKIINDLVAIPVADYLIPNTRQSRHNHLVTCSQIPTLKDYYKYTCFLAPLCTGTPSHFISLSYLLRHKSVTLCAKLCTSNRRYQMLFYRLTILNLSLLRVYYFLTIHLFYSINPLFTLAYRTPSDVLYRG